MQSVSCRDINRYIGESNDLIIYDAVELRDNCGSKVLEKMPQNGMQSKNGKIGL